jgi:hypothetical protein
MTVEIAHPSLIPSVARQSTTAMRAQHRFGLLTRCGMWLRRLNDTRALQGLDPRLARDIGVVPRYGDRGPEGFACDPRPLWGIGLTPQPLDVAPPWSRDRRGG